MKSHWDFSIPLRSIGIRGINLVPAPKSVQMALFVDEKRIQNKEVLEVTADNIRARFGKESICRAVVLSDAVLGQPNKAAEVIIPFAAAMHREQKEEYQRHEKTDT